MKVSILGRGESTLAVASEICRSDVISEVVLVDETRRLPRGAAQELEGSLGIGGHDATVTVSRTFAALADSEVAILLSPLSRATSYSGQTHRHTDLAFARDSAKCLKQHAPQTRILVAMPRANLLAHLMHQELGSEPGQVIGLSSVRASAYLNHQIANRFSVSATDIAALVVANDERVLVLPQYCRISGIPIDQLFTDAQIRDLTAGICDRHRAPRHEDNLYSLSVCLRQIIDSIGLDKKKIICASTLIRTSASSVHLGVPVKIGSRGVEEIIKLELTDKQQRQFTQLVTSSVANQQAKMRNYTR